MTAGSKTAELGTLTAVELPRPEYYYVFRTVGLDGEQEERDLASPDPFEEGQEVSTTHGGLPAKARVERIQAISGSDHLLLGDHLGSGARLGPQGPHTDLAALARSAVRVQIGYRTAPLHPISPN